MAKRTMPNTEKGERYVNEKKGRGEFSVRELEVREYKGKKYEFRYETPGFYDFVIGQGSYNLVYRAFDRPVKKSFTDELVGSWLEEPCLYGIFRDGEPAGIAEGSMESWNNRFRISNFLIFEPFRRQKAGKQLMEQMLKRAEKEGARMAVLETQSCNVGAIEFYKSCGFDMIGFDLYCYSNEDVSRGEVRIEMGIPLTK